MYHLIVKSIGASALIAITVMLASCGGSTQTSSAGGGSFSAGKTVVEGKVSPSGAVSAVFSDPVTGALATAYAPSLFNIILPRAEAQATVVANIEVCLVIAQVKYGCATTNDLGLFEIIVTNDAPGGLYEITFTTSDNETYSAEINVKNNTITSLGGVLLQDGEASFKIINTVITVTAPKGSEDDISEDDISEDDISEDDISEDEPVEKFVVCHKPDTPAQKNLVLPASAVPAHTGHGDTEGGCNIDF